MRGTKQVGIWSEMGSFWQPHPTQDQPAPPEGFEIDSRIGAAAPRAPAASKENSCPQAILKLHRPSSFDYRVRHRLPVFYTPGIESGIPLLFSCQNVFELLFFLAAQQ